MSSSATVTPRYPVNRFWPDPGRASPLVRFLASVVCLAIVWGLIFAYDQFGFPSGGLALLKQAEEMLLAFTLYGVPQTYGWAYVVGALFLIAFHGLGQSIAAFVLGLKITWRTFIPFYGAHSVLQSLPRNMWIEAVVAMSGPLFGSVFAMLSSLIFHLTSQPIFLAIAYFGYFYNLLSLTPLIFFDGNRIVAAIPRLGWLLGFISVGLMEVALSSRNQTIHCNVFLLFILATSLPQAFHSLLGTAPRRDLECSAGERALLTALYFGLLLSLGWMSSISFETLWENVTPEAMGD